MPRRTARGGGVRRAQRAADAAAAEAPLSPFERMPFELMVMILECCNNPEDLFNLVLACTIINNVFRAVRPRILNAVLRNAFPGTNFRDACWALRAACGARGLMTSNELSAIDSSMLAAVPGRRTRAEVIADLQEFVDGYHESYLDPAAAISDVTARINCRLASFFRLWWLVNRWTKRHRSSAQEMLYTYADQLHRPTSKAFGYSAPALPGIPTPDLLPCVRPLSRDETTRIHRAFLRFEIFRALVPPQFKLLSTPAARFVADRLKLTFAAWEWAEMYSIGHFLIGEVGELLGIIQDRAASKLIGLGSWNPPSNAVSTDTVLVKIECNFLCRHGHASIPHLEWMLFRLSHLGLPFLSLLQKSPFELQKVLIYDYCNMQFKDSGPIGDDFLTTFLSCATFSWSMPNSLPALSPAAQRVKDAMPGPSAGWERWRWHSIDRGFEGTAFVMWDKERLEDAQLLGQVPLPILLRGRRKSEKNARKLAGGLRRIAKMSLGADCGFLAYRQAILHDRTHRHTQRIVWENEYVGKKEEEEVDV